MTDLVERVARGLSKAEHGDEGEWELYTHEARAVIPIVLERAALAADVVAAQLRDEADQLPGIAHRTEQRTAEFIACSIRALSEEPKA